MTRYFIEDAKCGYDTFVDGCGPHATVASAIRYREDGEKTGWIYCVQPSGLWPMIALHDEDVYEEIIRGEFPEGPDYEADSFGGLSWNPADEEAGLFELFHNNKGNGTANLIHYAYDLCACPQDMESGLLALGIGHYSDEIDVPVLDDEKWWLEERE
jgi:hypothetical protein